MDTEATPKRESYTGWIVAVGLLLLLAAAVPIALKFYSPREFVMVLDGEPGGKIVWEFKSGMTTQTGVTNLPVRLAFKAREMEFTAQRTNYTGFLKLSPIRDGGSLGVVQTGGPTGGVRCWWSSSTTGLCGTP